MKKRMLALALAICMAISFAQTAFAYSAVDFSRIDDLDGNLSNSKHTVAYAVWEDPDGNYHIAISTKKTIEEVMLGDVAAEGVLSERFKTGLTVENANEEGEYYLNDLAPDDAIEGRSNDHYWYVISLTEQQMKDNLTAMDNVHKVAADIDEKGHALGDGKEGSISIPSDFVTYTVIWKDEDGTVLETDTGVTYGSNPSYDSKAPSKADDDQYTYTFTGWTPDLAPVTGDITYTAEYSATPKTPVVPETYTITVNYVDEEDNVIADAYVSEAIEENSEYDVSAQIPETIGEYNFVSADKSATGTLTADVVITATYAKTPAPEVEKYTITVNYVDEEDNVIADAYVSEAIEENSEYDVSAQIPETIGEYNFVSADKLATGTLTADVVITATYAKTPAPEVPETYTITVNYVDEEGNALAASYTETLEEGSAYDVSAQIPETIGEYSFVSADKPVTGTLTADVVITATYAKTPAPEVEKYTITVNYVDTNGTIIADPLSISLPAGSNYNVAGMIPIIIGSLDLQNTSGNLYGILNGNITITAVYGESDNTTGGSTEQIIEKIPLADIPGVFSPDHFAYIIGYTDGLVHPEANITRAEVATIFFRLLSDEVREANLTDENDFLDVDSSMWFNNAVSTMAAMGIVTGDEDGNFRPDDYITRAEFAAIAARFDPYGSTESVSLSDIDEHWAEALICIAANNGWIKGYDDSTFRPNEYITRAESVTLINRVLHRIVESHEDLLDDMIVWEDNMDITKWYYLAVQEATNSHYYDRRDSGYEFWLELREVRDWTVFERELDEE